MDIAIHNSMTNKQVITLIYVLEEIIIKGHIIWRDDLKHELELLMKLQKELQNNENLHT